MKQRQKAQFIGLIMVLIFLSSCISSNNTGSRDVNWRTGSDGIVMSFVQDNPPSEVLSRSKVPVTVKYSNKGAYDVSDLTFYLGGYDSNILPFATKSQVSGIRMSGKDQFNTQGTEEAFAQWVAPVVNLNNLQGIDNFKQAISVTACYTYGTIANPTICFDPSQFDTVAASKCSFSIKDLGSSQGGPIAVTSVTQKLSDTDIYLEIQIANSGKGNPFLPEIGDCMNLGYTEIDKVRLSKVAFSSGATFTCNPSIIRLQSNKGFAVCSAKLPTKSSFVQTPLIIQLSYKYREAMPTKEITVVNVNK